MNDHLLISFGFVTGLIIAWLASPWLGWAADSGPVANAIGSIFGGGIGAAIAVWGALLAARYQVEASAKKADMDRGQEIAAHLEAARYGVVITRRYFKYLIQFIEERRADSSAVVSKVIVEALLVETERLLARQDPDPRLGPQVILQWHKTLSVIRPVRDSLRTVFRDAANDQDLSAVITLMEETIKNCISFIDKLENLIDETGEAVVAKWSQNSAN